MPGRTPTEAAQAFLAPLQSALGCIARVKITPSSGGRSEPGKVHAWTINGSAGAVVGGSFRLKAAMWYQLVEERSERGPWRATTRGGYMYSVETTAGSELVAAHWHPESPGRHTRSRTCTCLKQS